MTQSRYPFHLRSHLSKEISACGNSQGVNLAWRSVMRVECKNCLKLICAGVETKYFKPRPNPTPEGETI